ncbi:MAG: rhamnulokinase, partial [Rubripirellula sp.]
QMTADACNRKVIAGPVEATAIGNVMMQMIGTGSLDSVAAGRVLVQKSFDTQKFEPQNPDAWTEPASRFAKL